MKRPKWRCVCDCGKETWVRSDGLTDGLTKSCGCLQREWAAKATGQFKPRHGMTRTATYNSWIGCRARCHSPSNNLFDYYGGRGIYVCDRWRDSFENFLSDMGECPPGHSLERIDNDGPYSPENCRWATKRDQARNRRSSQTVTYKGETLTIAEWSERTGIPYPRLFYRIKNWTVERALETREKAKPGPNPGTPRAAHHEAG